MRREGARTHDNQIQSQGRTVDALGRTVNALGRTVDALAGAVVAHDRQIEAHDKIDALIKISEENARNWKRLERQWEAYLNTLPRQ